MLRNVLYLYNAPEDTIIPEFTSIGWSYDSQGPVEGLIVTVVIQQDAPDNHLICYQVPNEIREHAPHHIKSTLSTQKYLGAPNNAQLDPTEGKENIIKKLHQRIGLIAMKADSIQEAKITNNMLVCQVATSRH
jgi:hypothetical protein